MKTNLKYRIVVLGILIALVTVELHANSVKFLKDIRFIQRGSKNTWVSFFLGKKKEIAIHPSSLYRLGPNRLCITDAVNGVLLIIDNNGKIIKKMTHAKGARIISPVCVCADGDGNMYVSDSGVPCVLLFDRKYKFKKVFIALPQSRITGIVFIRQRLYCVDTQNHRILCFQPDGRLLSTIGERGNQKGQFNFPTHITGDHQYIYVTDAMNFRVQIFDHDGRFIRTFGTHGRGGGNFAKPKGIAVDAKQRIYVTDAMFDNVQIFNLEGEFLYYFGTPGHMDSQFWMPSGIMIDPDNTIWVADTYNKRLQLFRLKEDTP